MAGHVLAEVLWGSGREEKALGDVQSGERGVQG